jgi:hypothetical protein
MPGSPAIGGVDCGVSLQAMRWRALKFACGKVPTPGKCGVGTQRRVSNCREALLPTLSILDAAGKGGNSNFCSSTDRFRGGTQSQPEGRSICRSRVLVNGISTHDREIRRCSQLGLQPSRYPFHSFDRRRRRHGQDRVVSTPVETTPRRRPRPFRCSVVLRKPPQIALSHVRPPPLKFGCDELANQFHVLCMRLRHCLEGRLLASAFKEKPRVKRGPG